jgi:hypothetical protein
MRGRERGIPGSDQGESGKSQVSRFQGFRVSKFQSFKVSEFQSFKVSRFQGFNEPRGSMYLKIVEGKKMRG